ncbi:MAG: hypothetical protein IJE43_05520 [Alphaproteobacteria bacterium]|nr:hypothetical protein [Alphaproteobacteria bacterium]
MKKKKKKRITKIILIVCIVWLLMCITDFVMATTCHRPLFCVNLTPDEHYEKFVGLGYSFDIVDNSKEFFKIDAYKGYIFGQEVCGNYID